MGIKHVAYLIDLTVDTASLTEDVIPTWFHISLYFVCYNKIKRKLMDFLYIHGIWNPWAGK